MRVSGPPSFLLARDVGAVVVHYRNAVDTQRCLESLVGAAPRPAVIVVVDNSPGDGSLGQLQAWASQRGIEWQELGPGRRGMPSTDIFFVVASANRGFGAGANLGWHVLQEVPGIAYLLLCNNDAFVAPDFLSPLLEALNGASHAALAAGTVRLAPPQEGIWFAGGEYLWAKCRGEHCREPATNVREVTFCTACCMLVRMEAMASIGGMPECYFLYFEDTEFCLRLRRAGRGLLYVPASVAYHRVSSSAGTRRTSPQVAFLSARNQCWFARRNMAPWQQAIVLPRVVLDELSRAAGAGLRGRPDLSWALVRGVARGLFGSWRGSEQQGERRDG